MKEIFCSEIMDIYIVGGLSLIVIVVFIISRIGILPKKSLPFIAAALAGAIGVGIFNKFRIIKLMKEYNKAKAEADRVKKEVKEMEENYKISQQKRDKIISEEENKIAAHEKQILLIKEKEKQKKAEIDKLTGDELNNAFTDFLSQL